MGIRGIYESVLYGEDLDGLHGFYAGVMGLRHVGQPNERGRTFRVNEAQVLLLFRASLTRRAHEMVPSHGSTGQGHVAFSVEAGSLGAWARRLAAAGYPIEREVSWPMGGRSIYVRDPAGNSVELMDGEVWPG